MNNTIFRRKFVFGVLIALMFGFGVHGTVDALTFGTTRTGDLQTLSPGQRFVVTFNVTLNSRVAVNSGTRQASQSLIDIAAADSTNGQDHSSYTAGDTYYYTTADTANNETDYNWSTEAEAYRFNEQAVTINPTNATIVRIGNYNVNIAADTAFTLNQLKKWSDGRSELPGGRISVTLEAVNTPSQVTIDITDATTDRPTGFSESEFGDVFMLYILRLESASRAATIDTPLVTSVVNNDQDTAITVGLTGDSSTFARVGFEVYEGPGTLYEDKNSDDNPDSTPTKSITAFTDNHGTAGDARVYLKTNGGTSKVRAWVFGHSPTTVVASKTSEATYIYRWATLRKVSGDATLQRGVILTQLESPFIVELTDAKGDSISGETITFAATGGGTLVKDPAFPDELYADDFPTTATVMTDSNGRASVLLTLGSAAGENTVTATYTEGDEQTFRATAQAESAAASIDIFSGNNQSADENAQLPSPLVVLVRDQNGLIISGQSVRFSTDSGALLGPGEGPGTLAPSPSIPHSDRNQTVNTDATGRASVRYNVGNVPGTKQITAILLATYDQQTRQKVFTATGGRATPPADFRVSRSSITGTPGQPVSVIVTGADPNAAVQIGSLAFGTANSNGSVTIFFNLPSTTGTHNVPVTSGGRSVSLRLIVQASTQTDVRIQIPGNSSHTGAANTPVTLDARVVNSSNQQVVSGVNVDFYNSNNVRIGSGRTNNSGIASYEYAILPSPTTQIVTAEVNDPNYTVSGPNVVTFTITLTGTQPDPTTKTISVTPRNIGGTAGEERDDVTVFLSDSQSGVSVNISSPFNVSKRTNTNGAAEFSLTLPQTVGSGTARVTASGYTRADLRYTVTGPGTTTQTPVRLIIPSDASNRLSGATGSSVRLRVQVVNNSNIGVPNVDVAFRNSSGQNLSTVQTNSSGEASVDYRVGSSTEVVTAVITDTDVDRSTATDITFTISSTGNQQTSTLTIIQTNSAGQTSSIGAPGALHTIRVLLPQRTANQRVILDVIRTSDQTNVGTYVLSSDVTGTATTPNTFKLPTTPGQYTITATAGTNTGRATLTVFAIRLVKDANDSVSGDDQEGDRGEVLEDPFALKVVRDSDNTAVQGVDVTFTVTDGDGELSASSSGANSSRTLTVRSNASGVVEAYLVLGEDDEDNAVRASISITGVADVTFTATGSLVPYDLEIVSGNNQRLTVNQRSAPLVVRVTDEDGNDLEDVTVSFSSRGPAGATLTRSAITDRLGEAEAIFVSRAAGTYSITARVAGIPTVTFTITVGDLADSIRIVSGNNQRGDPGTELANPLVVEVLDDDGDTVSGVTVTFRVTGGGGSLSATSVVTNSRGRAQTTLTLGNSPGGNSVRASVSGVSTQVTFTARSTPAEPDIRLPASQRADSYWINTDSGTLHRLVGGSVENIATGVRNAVSLVATKDQLYWVENTGNNSGRIRRSNLNGSNIQLIRDLTATPAGITVDTANSKIYLTNAWGKVQAINLDGSGYAPNLIAGLSDPKDIAVGSGKVYWITGGGTVHSANVDGSGVTQIAGGYSTLGSIAVGGGKVFWTEEISESDGNIHSANLNGTGVQEVVSLLAAPYGISVDTSANKLYFTNRRGRIMQGNFDGSGIQIVASNLVALGDVSVPSGTAAPRPPGTFSKYDVNRDGSVDNTDASLVAAALGESPPSNPRLDVNGDGVVNFLDLLLVFDNRDNANAAPVAISKLPNVSREEIQNQIEQLLASDNHSATAQFTLAYLQNLLEVVTPEKTRLLANYPNPFNPETWIPYQLATSSDVQITIYNSAGREVRTLSLGHQSKGYYTDRSRAAYWDGRNAIGEQVSSGVYFYTLTADQVSATRKMLILK